MRMRKRKIADPADAGTGRSAGPADVRMPSRQPEPNPTGRSADGAR